MSGSPLVQVIQKRLRSAGYSDLSTPLKVASVEFAFTGAMLGREGRALDLVLVVDTTTGDFGDRDGARVRQRIESLNRALDVTGSRYVVTVILAGAVLAGGIEALSETCRVLQVEGAALNSQGELADDHAQRQLDDRIRVLLPLTLPTSNAETQDGGGSTIEQLVRALPASLDRALLDVLVAACNGGERAVTDTMARIMNGALQSRTGEE